MAVLKSGGMVIVHLLLTKVASYEIYAEKRNWQTQASRGGAEAKLNLGGISK